MASIAFDSSGSPDPAKPPISLHPAFPAVVALWFAALLGIGSLLLPVVLLERAVEITRLSAIVPAASPPLGFMARGLIALVAALAGAAIGVAIARRVARSHDAGRPSRVAKLAKGARRPIAVNEELGGEGVVNGFGLPVNRRRALAIAEDDRPSDFLYMAPLPGDGGDQTLALDAPRNAAITDEPLELSDTFEDSPETNPPLPTDADPDEDETMTLQPEFPPLAPEPKVESRREFGRAGTRAQAEPLPFSAPSLVRRSVEADSASSEPVPAVPEAYAPEPDEAEAAESEKQPFRGDWSNAPLGELGLVQLVQRLGASLERRREWLASAAIAAPAPLLAPAAGIEVAPAEEAAQAMAAYFGKPGREPAGSEVAEDADDEARIAARAGTEFAPRPSPLGSWHAAEDEDEIDEIPSFTLPLRATAAPMASSDGPEAADAGDDPADAPQAGDSYGSLLAMRNPFAPLEEEFVRVDDPAVDDEVEPAVVFPGHLQAASPSAPSEQAARPFDPPSGARTGSAAAPADADAALRAALATLQRMSGTA